MEAATLLPEALFSDDPRTLGGSLSTRRIASPLLRSLTSGNVTTQPSAKFNIRIHIPPSSGHLVVAGFRSPKEDGGRNGTDVADRTGVGHVAEFPTANRIKSQFGSFPIQPAASRSPDDSGESDSR